MSFQGFKNNKVIVVTVDGRTLVGTLVACDQQANLVLQDTIERIIHTPGDEEPSTETPQGLYVVRGDNVVICGLLDEALDKSIDWTKVRGEVIEATEILDDDDETLIFVPNYRPRLEQQSW